MNHAQPDAPTFIHQFRLGPMDNFIYLIGDRATRQCAVVDPAWDAEAILREAERLDVRIAHILCTHSHFDHVNRVDALLERVDAPVHMLRAEVEFADFRCENLVAHRPGDALTVGDAAEIEMLHTPGHTPGSVCYRVGAALVAGDTLFVDGCGRCDLVGGDPETMYQSLRALCDRLPGATTLYPGHDYGNVPTATLDEQLRSNRWLQLPTLEAFVAHRRIGKAAFAASTP